jgi:hypothetical protein
MIASRVTFEFHPERRRCEFGIQSTSIWTLKETLVGGSGKGITYGYGPNIETSKNLKRTCEGNSFLKLVLDK